MPMIVSICQHCHEQQFRNTVRCTQHDLHGGIVRFMHMSTITRLHSFSEKNTRTPLVHLVNNLILILQCVNYRVLSGEQFHI